MWGRRDRCAVGYQEFFSINRYRSVGAGKTVRKSAKRHIFERKIRISPDIALCKRRVALHRKDDMFDLQEFECGDKCGADIHIFVRDVFYGQVGSKYILCGIDGLLEYLRQFAWFGKSHHLMECSPSRHLTDAESKRVDEAFALIPLIPDEESERRVLQVHGVESEGT